MNSEILETLATVPLNELPELTGDIYRSCLAQIHDFLRPRTYLEIGTFHGDSLSLARCATIAVDPNFQLTCKVLNESMPMLCFFQMRSDTFFASHNPRAIFGSPIDFAFLDGMHLVECLLRDFMHTEKFCHKQSLITLHDCVPLDFHMAGRDMNDMKRRDMSAHRDWWTGDVWKLLPILREYRPDLKVDIFNAPPTGLVLVRGLDPSSRVLEEHHDEIVSRFRSPADEYSLFVDFLTNLQWKDTTRLTEILSDLRN